MAKLASGNSRSIRSLTALAANASAARTLNLVSVWKRFSEQPEYVEQPLFRSLYLNRAIIVKHRLRPDERDVMDSRQTSATKVIIPISPNELKLGARSFFVGQRGYADFLQELSPEGGGFDDHDDRLLRLLDGLPSLDPFLMREKLKTGGFTPARCYFDVSDADTQRMFGFVSRELEPLIALTYGAANVSVRQKTGTLARKMLANASDDDLDPLRRGLGLTQSEFVEGVFCWKGFLYYKWTLTDLLPNIKPVVDEITRISPFDPMTPDQKTYIFGARENLARAIGQACNTVRENLRLYDDAYADLTRNSKPEAFRAFLLKAPALFNDLGERLGGLQHTVSFWRYRFPNGRPRRITAEELEDLLVDFEASLAFEREVELQIF